MDPAIKKLQDELEKVRSQLYVFYELTKAMRTTLRLDEITYIILTGLTAHEGLRFNRAAIFLVDEEERKINGFMGLGPIDPQEAGEVWRSIEEEQKNLYDLIDNYHRIKESRVKPKFMEFMQSLAFPLDKTSGLLFEILNRKDILYLKKDEHNQLGADPLVEKLNLKEFLICTLWIKGKPTGVVVVDNYVTEKAITAEDAKIFGMFIEEAAGAIENSRAFESTLVKSHTDPLTGLWNYGYFQYQLDEELARTDSDSGAVSIMMVDLDDFKKFNDTYGHIQGDKALRQIANVLRQSCRKIDILCRYGGEEFAFILPDSNKKEAVLLGERVRKSVAESEILNYRFTVSIGIASFPEDAPDKSTFIERADAALYAAKRQGKNRILLA